VVPFDIFFSLLTVCDRVGTGPLEAPVGNLISKCVVAGSFVDQYQHKMAEDNSPIVYNYTNFQTIIHTE